MTPESVRYEKLPGRAAGPGAVLSASGCRLWLASDHLLSVHHNGYSEDYKRFAFTDIQAITILRTRQGRTWNWFFFVGAGLSLLCLALSVAAAWHPAAILSWGIISGYCLLCLLVNSMMGPTCACYLRTGVQTERLYSLNRLPRTERVVGRLRACIEAAQGRISPEAVESAQVDARQTDDEAARALPPHPISSSRASSAPAKATRRVPLKPYHGHAHTLLFSLLGADLLFEASQYLGAAASPLLVGIGISLALAAVIVFALIRQHGSNLPLGIKVVSWVSLGYVFISFAIGSICSSVFMVLHPELQNNAWDCAKTMAAISPLDSVPRLILSIYTLLGSGTLSLTGLIMLATRPGTATPVAPPPLSRTPPEAPYGHHDG